MAISTAQPETTYQGARTMSDVTPMTLFDLDAAGLDPTQPAPPEFVQFLYDNSRTSYLTLWSARLGEPNAPAMITRWVNDALTVYHARALQIQVAPVGDKPAGTNVTEVTYTGPTEAPAPVNVNVPMVSGPGGLSGAVGQSLTCTMGNWDGEPTSYAYQFKSDGSDVAGAGNTYVVADTDAGKSITCVVTATNAGGSTAAPPSNAVLIAGAQADASTSRTPASSTNARHDSSGDDTKVSGTAPKEGTTRRGA